MKRFLTIAGALVLCLALTAGLASAAPGTLYEQEEGTNDADPVEVDAAGEGPEEGANCGNWIYQYGSGSWSGVYAGDDGWVTCDEDGDEGLDVEADVEMYCSTTTSNNKVYFHIGNIYSATTADLTALVNGTMQSNNGQWIGISFQGQGKSEEDFEKDGGGAYTGVITGGMQSDHHTYGTQDEQMDLEIKMRWNGGAWQVPGAYGDGAHSTITDTLWWLVDGGNAGSYTLDWRIRLLPETDQPDGDYYIDPAIVCAPIL